jgi:hypothetical protein
MKKVVVLFLLMLSLTMLSSCGSSDTQTPMPNPNPNNPPANDVITLTFSALSSQNYTLEKVEGATTVGMAGTTDPEITLEVGKRYRIINQVLGTHPFRFSSSTTYTTVNPLLTESGGGSFATNASVNFAKNSDGFSFTLTSELATQLKSYLCGFHSDMFGLVKTN